MKIFEIGWVTLLGLLAVLPGLSLATPDTPPPAGQEGGKDTRSENILKDCESFADGGGNKKNIITLPPGTTTLSGPVVCPAPLVRVPSLLDLSPILPCSLSFALP